ncbi:MAG: hypothetical protein ACOH5I_09980 [Oligoflexus sp.]
MVQSSATAQALTHPHHSINPNAASPELEHEHEATQSLQELWQIWNSYLQGDLTQTKRLQRELKRTIDLTLLELAEKQHELACVHSASSQAQSLHLRRLGKKFSKEAQSLKKKNFDQQAMQRLLQDLQAFWLKA